MPATSRRPSLFRFGLRTLLVLVTIACCWLGWQSSIVRQRKALLRELGEKGGYQFVTAEDSAGVPLRGTVGPVRPSVGLTRRWLGDQAYRDIWYVTYGMHPAQPADLKRVARIFPEAELRESLPEPCHPGCFPRGSLVRTPAGPRAIEDIQPGDLVTSVGFSGQSNRTPVQSVFVTENVLWRIDTEAGSLLTTEAQPLCLASTKIVPAGELRADDQLLIIGDDGQVRPTTILGIYPTHRLEQVFNLVVADTSMLVVGQFLVRSKPPFEHKAGS